MGEWKEGDPDRRSTDWHGRKEVVVALIVLFLSSWGSSVWFLAGMNEAIRNNTEHASLNEKMIKDHVGWDNRREDKQDMMFEKVLEQISTWRVESNQGFTDIKVDIARLEERMKMVSK